MDGLKDVEAVRLCGKSTPDGARVRTFVALVAAVARDRGGRVAMVVVLGMEEEGLWCPAPPAIILATAVLSYVPGHGGRTGGCWARHANAAEKGYAPPREISRHQPLGRPLDQGTAAVQEIPPFTAMGAADDPHCALRVPHQAAEGEQAAGGAGDEGGAVVVEVLGADGAPPVWQIADGG